jgi:ABC-type transport system involved in cytochrome bd biosynthesis fused ATPase/permease subunit
MGFKSNWKKLTGWWGTNALANQKKLSAGISWFLVMIISSAAVPLIAWVQGDRPNWPAFIVILITASVALLVMIVESVFGKAKAPDTQPITTG